jgi:hypothetical protein
LLTYSRPLHSLSSKAHLYAHHSELTIRFQNLPGTNIRSRPVRPFKEPPIDDQISKFRLDIDRAAKWSTRCLRYADAAAAAHQCSEKVSTMLHSYQPTIRSWFAPSGTQRVCPFVSNSMASPQWRQRLVTRLVPLRGCFHNLTQCPGLFLVFVDLITSSALCLTTRRSSFQAGKDPS